MDTHETGTQVIRILVDIFDISQNREGAGYGWALAAPIPQYATNKKNSNYVGHDAQGGTTYGAIDEASRSSKAINKRIIKTFRGKNAVIARFRNKNEVFFV